ncbi:MAG: protein kinase [Polyangia bacterium]
MILSNPVGRLFAGRFLIEQPAGSGGMGTVYRARDATTERTVALKLLQSPSGHAGDAERFAREALLLSELKAPGIVGYVAHGTAPDGQRYLAMEWLEGEDLASRLRRGPLSISETLTLLRSTSEALAFAHGHGVIHRDLKPSNLFLPGSDVHRVKLLDFGIARRTAASQVMTRTGLLIGTPDYMAPEQARGERVLRASADIFSLGCVIYECLSGQPPFSGEHVAAVLVRILFEPPPPLHERRPDLPPPLLALLERMLAKEPADRPEDAQKLLAEIDRVVALSGELPTVPVRLTPTLAATGFAHEEQELLCVIIASADARAAATPEPSAAPRVSADLRALVGAELQALGARVEWLLDGALVVTLSGSGNATDQAARAARAALLIRARWPEAATALATGHASVRGSLPVGEAVDRAARLLRWADEQARGLSSGASGVWLDELSAGLLARRFVVTPRAGHMLLSGEELTPDEEHLLLGRPTPCIGREQELGLLEAILSGCIEEGEAQVVLITAPPGNGKSRLCREFLRRVRLRPESVTVLLGRGDMMTVGSPYAILRDLFRRLCRLRETEQSEHADAAARAQRLHARICQSVPPTAQQHAVAFLSELCGLPLPDGTMPLLRAARSDPKIMSDQITEAFLTFLRAECASAPVLLVLDDLHWADALTVRLIGAVLRELSDQPLLVLALARPGVTETFPKLWSGLRVRNIELGGLSRKASERLIQQALGKDVQSEVVARLVEQAAGSPLFLEELVRAVAQGSADELPQTVLAMVKVRIQQVELGARRVLRAASVFGQSFWLGGLRALLRPERTTSDLDGALRRLVEAELITQRSDSRLPGETEYSFRHALLREAAYSLLTDPDRVLGHRLAADYLEQAGETDALVLAEHCARGGEPGRAAAHYLQAGWQSLERSDLEGALTRGRHGLGCAPADKALGETLGNLHALVAMAHCWRSELELAFPASLEALPLLRAGGRWECSTLFHGMWAALVTGHEPEFQLFAGRLTRFRPQPEAERDLVLWAALGASLLSSYGRRQLAHSLLVRAEAQSAELPQVELDLRGAQLVGRSDYVRAFEADPWLPLSLSAEASAAFAEIGDRRDQTTALTRLGQAQGELGDLATGEQTLRQAVELARRSRQQFLVNQCELHLAALLARSPERAAQGDAEQLALAMLLTGGLSAGYRGWCHGILAQLAIARGQPEDAVRLSQEALPLCQRVPLRYLWVQAQCARALLDSGETRRAQQVAHAMLERVEHQGGAGYVEVLLRAVAARVFAAAGEDARAAAQQREARRQLLLRADRIPQPDWRSKYLNGIAEHAALLADPPPP